MTRPESNSPPDVMAQVLAQNPALRARAERIMDAFLDNVERAVKIGDPQTMATYAKTILPGMIRSLREGEAAEGMSKREAATKRIQAALRGEDTVDDDD